MLGCALSLFVGFGVPVLSIFHCFECVTDLVTCYATVFAEISRRNRVLFNMMMHDTDGAYRPTGMPNIPEYKESMPCDTGYRRLCQCQLY